MRKLLVLGLMFGTIAAWNSGCSGDDDDDDHEAPVSIAITGGTSVNVGSNLQLTATATYADSSTEDITTDSAWTTNSAGVATVGAATGLVTGVSAGTATISATHDDVVGTTTITVGTGGAATSSLTFTGSGWPHNGSIAYVRILENGTPIAGGCLASTAISGQAFSINFGAILTQGHTYTYETFADLNADSNYDTGGGDHNWVGSVGAVTTGTTTKNVPHADAQAALTWTNNAGCPGT